MPEQHEIDAAGPWFQNVRFLDGKESRPGNHYPRCVWGDVLPHLPDLHGKTVLDIGCNGGFMEIELERLGAKVTAIDREPKYVKQSLLVKHEFGLDCSVLEFNIEDRDSTLKYDVVLMLGVIYHVDNPIRALTNTIRAARELVILETDIDLAETGSKAQFFDFPEPYRYTWRPSLPCMRKLIGYCGGILQSEHQRGSSSRFIYLVKPGGVEGVGR